MWRSSIPQPDGHPDALGVVEVDPDSRNYGRLVGQWCPAPTRRASTIIDTKPDARRPELVKVIEGQEVQDKTGYAALHTVALRPRRPLHQRVRRAVGDEPRINIDLIWTVLLMLTAVATPFL